MSGVTAEQQATFRQCGTFFRATCLTLRRSLGIGPWEFISGHLVLVLRTLGLVLSLLSVEVVSGGLSPAKSVKLLRV